MRVLIIDDHAGFRRLAHKLLTRSGYDVVGEAADGRGALAEAARLRPDVVLLDVQLPDIDGVDVAHALAADNPDARVVLVSSRAASDFGARLDSAPAVGFLSKSELTGPALGALLGGAC